jgi:predicted esterase
MAAGQEDPTIPLARARRSAELLRLAGAALDYREYPTGHKLTAAGLADLRAWLNEWR